MNRALQFLGQRSLQFIPVILLATLVVFGLVHLIPGDPAITLAGENATLERIEEIRRAYGLDQPFLVQYGRWLAGVAQGDLALSMLASKPVLDLIMGRVPATLQLGLGAILVGLLLGVPVGVPERVPLGVPVALLSTSPERNDTILVSDPFAD